MTKTEIQHVYFGVGVTVMAIAALWAWRRPNSVARYIWPGIAVIIGLFLFLPAEDGANHYEPWGWGRTLGDLWPIKVDRWLPALAHIHIVQHKIAGLFALGIGVVELGRAVGWLKHRRWGRLLPFASIGVGLAIAVHGGSEHHLPNAAEQMHHWIFGAAFVSGGVLLALHQAGRLKADAWRYAWPALVLVAGLDLLLLYRIPG